MIVQVWRKWSTGSAADVVDPSLAGQYPEEEIFNCLEVGLLCVQENPADRPDASAVVLLQASKSPQSQPSSFTVPCRSVRDIYHRYRLRRT
jgi:hypothetical protein